MNSWILQKVFIGNLHYVFFFFFFTYLILEDWVDITVEDGIFKYNLYKTCDQNEGKGK